MIHALGNYPFPGPLFLQFSILTSLQLFTLLQRQQSLVVQSQALEPGPVGPDPEPPHTSCVVLGELHNLL